ncbi:hypothetical protein [Humibacillus xanthopallidus]|uniref:Uncharacterized protein n=1 Tax=Humibacillus xanthopallidus TaxID=412689 RepID=A0A543HUB2_9MICO|nr:hypothetical protein [Humibacillus xanthopallidus]TQM61946.1 hypothetical protein FBY41_1968 [Humibacillus xanthopallidus]
MADLELNGTLDLVGAVELTADGGKVLVNTVEALVEDASGTAPAPVPLPQPSSPADQSTNVKCVKSLGAGVTAGGKTVVTTGLVLQGIWPGMIIRSTQNQRVTANMLPINVKQDTAVIFPSGSSVPIDTTGQ